MKLRKVLGTALPVVSCLIVGMPCSSAYPDYPQKPFQGLTFLFKNESASKIRTEMQRSSSENKSIFRRLQRETKHISAYGSAKFITGQSEEILRFEVFQNGKSAGVGTFGPFPQSSQRTLTWDGNELRLLD